MKIVLNKEQSKRFIQCLMPAIRKLAREEKLAQSQSKETKTAGAS